MFDAVCEATFDDMASLRHHLKEENNAIEAYTQTIADINKQAHQLTGRHTIRQQIHLTDKVAALEAHIANVRSGEYTRHMENKFAPLFRARRGLNFKDKSRATKIREDVDESCGAASQEIAHGSSHLLSNIGRDECQLCGHPLILLPSKALMCCSRCGCSIPFIDVTATVCQNFSENTERAEQTYKRINHFSVPASRTSINMLQVSCHHAGVNHHDHASVVEWEHSTSLCGSSADEWLCSIQNKSSVVIGEDILTAIMVQLHHEKIQPDSITHLKLRDVLKKMPIRKKAYEHVTQIHAKLTGHPAPKLTPQIEVCCSALVYCSGRILLICSSASLHKPPISTRMQEMCRVMFAAVNQSFERHCPQDRTNFLSYPCAASVPSCTHQTRTAQSICDTPLHLIHLLLPLGTASTSFSSY